MEKYTHDIGKMKKNRLMHFQIGLIIALGVALACVNFTTDIYEKEDKVSDLPEVYEIMVTPNTVHPPKVTPPPVIEVDPENLIEDEIEFEEEPEPEVEPSPNPSPEPKTKPTLSNAKPPRAVKKPTPVAPAPPVIAPEPEVEPEDNSIVTLVEYMPRFKMTDDKNLSEDEIKKYADAELIGYISKNMKYPAIARENGIEGTVVVRFVVEKNGKVSGLEVLRDPGGGLGKEAKRVVESMPKWERVGRQNGRSVRVYFTMPIKFQLSK